MGWHLTWQDPVALGLVVVALLVTRWHKRKLQPVGCAKCREGERGSAARAPEPPTRVPVERLRIGRARR